MRRHKRQIVGGVVALLAICFFIKSVHSMHVFEENMRYISFVTNGQQGFSIPETLEENQTLWNEYENKSVENEALYRKADTSVLALHGRSDLLFQGASLLGSQSNTSCLVSADLAYELFGDTHVSGLSVTYEGKQYDISGVIGQKGNLFVYEPEKEEVFLYERLATSGGEHTSISILEETLQMKFGSGKVLDYTFIRTMLELYLLILPVMLSIFLLRTVRKYQKESRSRWEACFWIFLFCIIGGIAAVLICKNIQIPLDMIPEKWSDFEFWTNYIKNQQENIMRIWKFAKTTLDIRMVRAIGSIVFYNGVAVVCSFYALWAAQMHTIKKKGF